MAVAPAPSLDALLAPDAVGSLGMCIAGTRLSVRHLAARYRVGERPEDFHASNPDVPLAAFYAALGYYFANKSVVDAEIEEAERRGLALAQADFESKRAKGDIVFDSSR